MNALTSPSFAARAPLGGARQKPSWPQRPTRAVGHRAGAGDNGNAMATDSVFKRLPAIGDTPPRDKQHF